MTNETHKFGPYTVTLLQDGVFEPPSDMLVHGGGTRNCRRRRRPSATR